eukprot:6206755-Pyramimonas_sp.AAC.1
MAHQHPAHPFWRRKRAAPARLCDTGAYERPRSGTIRTPNWCREYATPVRLDNIDAFNAEKVPRMICFAK